MRPITPPATAAASHSASLMMVASNTPASRTKAWTAAKLGGTARRHIFTTLPRACEAIVHRQIAAKATVATFDRLRGPIIGEPFTQRIHRHGAAPRQSYNSIVELRRVLLALALLQVVVDPQRCLLLRHHVGDLLV